MAKTDTLRPEDLDQKCEMFDVPGIRIVKMNLLLLARKNDPETKLHSIQDHGSIGVR